MNIHHLSVTFSPPTLSLAHHVLLCLQEAALSGGARDPSGQLMQLTTSQTWKQNHLQKLNLSAGGNKPHNLQVLVGGPNIVEPRLLAAIRGLVATYQSEVENLTLEVLGSWDRPLNKQNEVGGMSCILFYLNHCSFCFCCGESCYSGNNWQP